MAARHALLYWRDAMDAGAERAATAFGSGRIARAGAR
jgi:hypothetical protein